MIRSRLLATCVVLLAAAPALAAPSVTLRTTVNLSVGDPLQQTCGAAEWIAVAPGTEVSLCYTIENTGDQTLTRHDLVDVVIGPVLMDFPYALSAGASAFISEYHTPGQTTVYTATWTSREPGAMLSASDTDSAFVIVPEPGAIAGGLAALASLGIAGAWRREP